MFISKLLWWEILPSLKLYTAFVVLALAFSVIVIAFKNLRLERPPLTWLIF